MTDRINIEIISSGGKDCLAVDNNIVSGPWTGQGRTINNFSVSIERLESIIADHKRRAVEKSHD